MDTQPEPTPSADDFKRAERSTGGFNEPISHDLKKASPSTRPLPENHVVDHLGHVIDYSKPLRNRKHERFCILLAKGFSQADAYWKSVSATASKATACSRGSTLAKLPEVAERSLFLTKKVEFSDPVERAKEAENIDLSRDNLLDKLREIITSAANPSAAITAIQAYAELASIGPEERDTGQLTPDQAARYAAAAADNLQARLRDSGAIVVEIITGTARVRQECATLEEAHKLLDDTIGGSVAQ